VLDSPRPSVEFRRYAESELRYKLLSRTNPGEYQQLMGMAQEVVRQKWEIYEDMASRNQHRYPPDASVKRPAVR